MNKLWLVIKNTDNLRTWTKYFESDRDMDIYKNKIKSTFYSKKMKKN